MSDIPLPIKNISCQNLLSYQNVIHHGILRRQTDANKLADSFVKEFKNLTHFGESNTKQLVQWPRRYIVLYDGCLYMYKDETSTKPVRAQSLYGFMKIEPCLGSVPSSVTWPFKIAHALDEKGLSLYFSAPTEKDMKAWVECLHEQLLYANNFNPASQKQSSNGTESWETKPMYETGRPIVPNKPMAKITGAPADNYLKMDCLTISEDDDDGDDYDDYDKILELPNMKNKWLEKSSTLPVGKNPPCSGPSWQSKLEHSSSMPPSPAPPMRTTRAQAVVKPAVASKSYIPSQLPSLPAEQGFKKPVVGVKPNINPHQLRANNQALPEDNYDNASVEYVSGPDYTEPDEFPSNALFTVEKAIESAYWYGSSEEADSVMKTITTPNVYMIRGSSQEAGSQTLLYRCDGTVKKYRIRVDDAGKLFLELSGPTFYTLTQLISFYQRNMMPMGNPKLGKPYSAVWKQ